MKIYPKYTSFHYGADYQQRQLKKFLDRRKNDWRFEIDLIIRLTDKYARERLKRHRESITLVDFGCSIGTYAIEFAKKGYRSIGIDFDDDGIRMAKELSKKEGVKPRFLKRDITDLGDEIPEIDVAVFSNIFEHLHDDELGAVLEALKKKISPEGFIVYITKPTAYYYIFFGKKIFRWPLYAFRWLPEKKFTCLVKIYHYILDIGFLLKNGQTRRESAKRIGHCNPTTLERLSDIFARAGFKNLFIKTDELYPMVPGMKNRFSKYSISHPFLYGVVAPD